MKVFLLSLVLLLLTSLNAQAFHPGFGHANVQVNVGRSVGGGFGYGHGYGRFSSAFGYPYRTFGYGFGGVYPVAYPAVGLPAFSYGASAYGAPAYGAAYGVSGGCSADPLPPLTPPQRTRVTIIESVP